MNNLLVNCDVESSESKDSIKNLLKDYYNNVPKFFNDQQNIDKKALILRNNF